jgi:transmembrane sensor
MLDVLRREGRMAEVLEEVRFKLKRQRRRRRTALRTAVAAVAVVGALSWLIPVWARTSVIETSAGERRSATLADGSKVEASGNTLLKADFRFGRRRVILSRGEAWISVAKAPSEPFRVRVGNGTVEVLGTVFDVRAGSDGEKEVTLVEGSVAVDAFGGRTELAPGERYSFGQGGRGLEKLAAADLERLSAWREGQIAFDGMTLAEAAERIGDYFGTSVAVAPEIATLKLGGGHPLDSARSVLDALAATQHFAVRTLSDGTFELTGK